MKSLPGNVYTNVEKSAGNTARDGRVFDILKQFPHLEQLASFLTAGGSPEALAIPKSLRVRELAMLEAELRNQGLLTPGNAAIAGCFAHRASLDASNWRWRARRMRAKSLPVRINVPRYLITWAEELIASLVAHDHVLSDPSLRTAQLPAVADRRDLNAKLSYLDQFAAYLLGTQFRDSDQYGRGFQALLRVIAAGEQRATEEAEAPAIEALILPTTRNEFHLFVRSGLDAKLDSGR